ncbi:hypothetical protein [Mesorhizobium sp. ISC15]|uniref:hypothetical protein n=1 Tax=Mesorhizobium sp. ISC15 TaxID=3076429 RepID=UPI00301D66EB
MRANFETFFTHHNSGLICSRQSPPTGLHEPSDSSLLWDAVRIMPASEKLVSLFEPHADIIAKGSRAPLQEFLFTCPRVVSAKV